LLEVLPQFVCFLHTLVTYSKAARIAMICTLYFMHHFLLFAAMAFELVLCVQFIIRILLQRYHIPQNMILRAYFACRAKVKTVVNFRANQVSVLSLQFKPTRFASWWGFRGFRCNSQELSFVSAARKTRKGLLFH